jgi:hypothetical protein
MSGFLNELSPYERNAYESVQRGGSGPLREGLKRLVEEGDFEKLRKKGFEVVPPPPAVGKVSGLPPPPEAPADPRFDRIMQEAAARYESERPFDRPVGEEVGPRSVTPPSPDSPPPVATVQPSAPVERHPFVDTGYGPSRRETRKSVVVKTLPRMTAWGVRKMTIEGFAKNGYAPTNVTRTTTGKTIITFVRP